MGNVMRISVVSRIAGLVACLLFFASLIVAYMGLQNLKVGGPVYDKIVLGKDLIADVLPPPLYVIEAFLETESALRNPDKAKEHHERFIKLKADFDARQAYWLAASFDPQVKAQLTSASFRPAEDFWTLGETAYFPKLEAGDIEAANAIFIKLAATYDQHRTEIERVVELANKMNAATEAMASSETTSTLMLAGSFAGLTLTVLIAFSLLMQSYIAKPIETSADAMRRMAAGEHDMQLPSFGGLAEMKAMDSALKVFQQNAVDRAELMAEVSQSRQDAEERRQHLETLAIGFLEKADRLKATLDRQAHIVRGSALAFSRSVAITESEAKNGLSSSSDAADGVKSVALAADELSRATVMIAEQAVGARRVTGTASESAEVADRDVKVLTEVIGQIRSILDSIGSIATQTNLLSLNATIEASRAGEAGRGFAVVAAEVKSLAGETAKATAEVSRLLSEINQCTDKVVGSITAIVTDVATVNTLTDDIARAVDEQQRATQGIADSAARAATSTAGALETSRKVSDVVNSTRKDVETVDSAASSLFNAIQEFSDGIDHFLGSISTDMKDRRKHIRHDVGHFADVAVDGRSFNTRIHEISLSGASFNKVYGVTVGKTVDVTFDEVTVKAKVIWVNDTRFGIEYNQVLKDFPVSLDQNIRRDKIAA